MRKFRLALFGSLVALVLAACSTQTAPTQVPADGTTNFKAYVLNLDAESTLDSVDAVLSSGTLQTLSAQAMSLGEENTDIAANVYEFTFSARPGDTLDLSASLEGSDASLTLNNLSLFEGGQAVTGEVSGHSTFKVVLERSEIETQSFTLVRNIQLLGANEVPAVETPASGRAKALLIADHLFVSGRFRDLQGAPLPIAGSASHIHSGARGTNGPIVFNLNVRTRRDNRSGSLRGFGRLPDPSAVEDGSLYINLHTEAFNGGELRGQISEAQPEGAVFTMDNEADGNDVVATTRWSDGAILGSLSFDAVGNGTGAGLNGASNPLIVTEDRRFLFAVNGGSDEISVFKIDNLINLEFVGKISSGGAAPISVTTSRNLLYVLNAGRDGTPGNIAGFRFSRRTGAVEPLSGSAQPLDTTPGDENVPAQILFSPRGRFLVVTDRSPNNTITTYRVRAGRAEAPVTQASAGATPFGFEFASDGTLVVSEAQMAGENASTVTSYNLESAREGRVRFGKINPISAEVPVNSSDACWVEITENGRYVYTTNTMSDNISGLRLLPDGSLRQLDDNVAFTPTGVGPLDMENVGSDYLYVHSFEDDGESQLTAFRVIQGTGELIELETRVSDLPASARGVAAY